MQKTKAMKDAQKNKKAKHHEACIDLPAQKIWKELDQCVVESSLKDNLSIDQKKAAKIEHLMDQAFDLLLDKLIRQS